MEIKIDAIMQHFGLALIYLFRLWKFNGNRCGKLKQNTSIVGFLSCYIVIRKWENFLHSTNDSSSYRSSIILLKRNHFMYYHFTPANWTTLIPLQNQFKATWHPIIINTSVSFCVRNFFSVLSNLKITSIRMECSSMNNYHKI